MTEAVQKLFFDQQRTAFLDHVEVLPDFLTDEEVRVIVGRMKAHDPSSFARGVVGTGQDAAEAADIRKSKVKWIPRTPEWDWLYAKLAHQFNACNYNWWQFGITGFDEEIQLSRYEGGSPGDGGHFYHYHMDCGSGFASKRKLSMIIQLSDPDDYKGGDVEVLVTKSPFKISKKRGSAVIFPSYIMHRVREVTEGVRLSLVVWLHGPAFV